MADLDPNKKKIAQLLRMLSSSGGERRNAWTALERAMQSDGTGFSDIGNAYERGCGCDDGKYTEDDLQQFGHALRAEGVEAGIKIGLARAGNGSGGGSNGQITVPAPADMADFCHQRLSQMKDDAQRDFIRETYQTTQRGRNLQPGTLGYLISIYLKHRGRFQC